MKLESWGLFVLAALIGVLYQFVAASIWGIYVASEIAPGRWLIDFFGSGTALFWGALYAHDTLINVLIAVPFAAVLVLVQGLNNWLCVCLAVLAGLVATYWGAAWASFPLLVQSAMWWAGLAMQIFSIPIAFVVLRAMRRPWNGKNSPMKAHRAAA